MVKNGLRQYGVIQWFTINFIKIQEIFLLNKMVKSIYVNKEITDPGFCLYWKNNKPHSPVPPHRKLKVGGATYKEIDATCHKSTRRIRKKVRNICRKWRKDKTISPFTGKKIKKGGPEFKSFDGLCSDQKATQVKKSKRIQKKIRPGLREAENEINAELDRIEELFLAAQVAEQPAEQQAVQVAAQEFTQKKYDPSCLDGVFENIELKPAQTRVVRELLKLEDDGRFHGVLVAHGTGTGKTEIMIGTIACAIKNKLVKKITLITTKSLISEFQKRLVKYNFRMPANIQFEAMTYDTFYLRYKEKSFECAEDRLLIIDEVHNLRNPSSKKYQAIQDCAFKSKMTLVLTATPFVNEYKDMVPLLKLIMRKNYADLYTIAELSDVFEDPESHAAKIKHFKNKISWFYDRSEEDFPEMKVTVKKLYMSPSYEDAYKKLEDGVFAVLGTEKDLTKFYTALRTTTNKIAEKESAKYEEIKKLLLKKKQTVLYSEFLEKGIDIYTDFMDANDISYAIISGETSPKERKSAVEGFNNGEIQVLVISKAGELGLDLMNTRKIIFANLPWNFATYEQVVGRGVRFRSHVNLPEKDRNVKVYVFIQKKSKENKADKKKKDLAKIKKFPSIDSYLWNLINEKKEKKEQLDQLLKSISIQ
jgi:superfamily II DNA or RNA helicase